MNDLETIYEPGMTEKDGITLTCPYTEKWYKREQCELVRANVAVSVSGCLPSTLEPLTHQSAYMADLGMDLGTHLAFPLSLYEIEKEGVLSLSPPVPRRYCVVT
jgi:hypothetical protein